MQTDTSIGIRTWGTILQITFDRASHLCQLATNLMMTSRLQINFQQMIVLRMTYQFITENSLLTVGLLRVISI